MAGQAQVVDSMRNNEGWGNKSSITLLVPCFNEQDSIELFYSELCPVLSGSDVEVEILFVDDGSHDDSVARLRLLASRDARVRVIALSRNFGKEAALTAGLDYATGDAVIPIDVDLQDPVELIPDMVMRWRQGADVVLARRRDRSQDGWLRRFWARFFYRLIARLNDAPFHEDVGDYRLLDRVVVDAVRLMREKNRFMKGLFSWPGFRTEVIDYDRPARSRGNSKWRWWKLFNYALDGVFSFSTAPLRIWTYIGGLMSLLSLAYLVFVVLKTLIYGVDWPGYASIVSIILFFSGINLVGLGIIGEYLGRVFIEVKQRPLYLVRETIGFEPHRAE